MEKSIALKNNSKRELRTEEIEVKEKELVEEDKPIYPLIIIIIVIITLMYALKKRSGT